MLGSSSSHRKSFLVRRHPLSNTYPANDPSDSFALWSGDISLLSQQRATATAVRIVTLHALCVRAVPLQWRRFLMAGETDFLLRHEQIQRRHVTLCLGQMADGAWKRHSGMHKVTFGFVRVTGRTVRILGEDARVLNGGCLRA